METRLLRSEFKAEFLQPLAEKPGAGHNFF
jgi:hypothetical protein